MRQTFRFWKEFGEMGTDDIVIEDCWVEGFEVVRYAATIVDDWQLQPLECHHRDALVIKTLNLEACAPSSGFNLSTSLQT